MEVRPLRVDPIGSLSNGRELASNDDNHDSPTPVGNDDDGQSTSNRMEVRPLHGDPIGPLSNGRELASNLTTFPGDEVSQGDVVPQHLIPSRISKITQLTLDQFDNNYRLFAQKLMNDDSDLTIRVILLKNNTMFLNYTFKILGSSNIQEAILASTCKVCTIFWTTSPGVIYFYAHFELDILVFEIILLEIYMFTT